MTFARPTESQLELVGGPPVVVGNCIADSSMEASKFGSSVEVDQIVRLFTVGINCYAVFAGVPNRPTGDMFHTT